MQLSAKKTENERLAQAIFILRQFFFRRLLKADR
jgi:hypothetical protein